MTPPEHRLTPQEYLARERKTGTKNEFFDGRVFAMAGADEAHNLLVAQVVGEFYLQFRGRACRVYPSDMRVKVEATGLYTYPDVIALCGSPQFEDAEVDTLTNPQVIVEVLSPSTEAYDRGDKFAMYRTLPSLTDYLLVSSNQARIEHYSRQDDASWRLVEKSGLSETLHISSVDVQLPLANVYDKVQFPPLRKQVRRRARTQVERAPRGKGRE